MKRLWAALGFLQSRVIQLTMPIAVAVMGVAFCYATLSESAAGAQRADAILVKRDESWNSEPHHTDVVTFIPVATTMVPTSISMSRSIMS